jgi:hypothetical protein
MQDYEVDQWPGSDETETLANCLHDRCLEVKARENEPRDPMRAAVRKY